MFAKPMLEDVGGVEVVAFAVGSDTPNCYSLPFGGGDKLVLHLTPTQLLLGIVAFLRPKTDEVGRREDTRQYNERTRRLSAVLSKIKFTRDVDTGGNERPEFEIPLARSDFGLTVGTNNTVVRIRATSFISLAIASLLKRITADEEKNKQTTLDASEIGMDECEILAVARDRSYAADKSELSAAA